MNLQTFYDTCEDVYTKTVFEGVFEQLPESRNYQVEISKERFGYSKYLKDCSIDQVLTACREVGRFASKDFGEFTDQPKLIIFEETSGVVVTPLDDKTARVVFSIKLDNC